MAGTHTSSDINVVSEAELASLVARYDELICGDVHRDGDCHWQLGERFSYGEHAGWFVEHHGSVHVLASGEFGEAGPFASREAAMACMAESLRAAIVEAEEL